MSMKLELTFHHISESAENLSLEDSKKKWNEAQKTRYVRAKQPRNVETTLTNEEIFDKRTPVDKESNGWWKSYCQQASHVQFDIQAAQNTKKYYDSQKIIFWTIKKIDLQRLKHFWFT